MVIYSIAALLCAIAMVCIVVAGKRREALTAQRKVWREQGLVFMDHMLSHGVAPWLAAEAIGVPESEMLAYIRGHKELPTTIVLAVQRLIILNNLKCSKVLWHTPRIAQTEERRAA